MLIDKKETTVAYRCPACGASVMSMVGVFALSGDMLKLKCSCGGSELTMVYTPDRKLRMTVPCLVCEKPHNFLLGSNTFFGGDGDVFRLPCTYTGIDLCFIGKKDAVQDAVEDANKELVRMMEDAGLDDLSLLRSEEKNEYRADPEVDEVVRFMLADLKEEGKIHCRCKTPERASYKYTVMDKYIRIYCEGCGGVADFPLTGVGSAMEFLSTDEINLE